MGDSLAELTARLLRYETQLANLPEDAEGLRKMLEELVGVTAELISRAQEDLGSATTSKEEEEENENRESRATTIVQESEDKNEALKVGSIVVVSGGERPYAGAITAVYDPPAASGVEIAVKYFEYETEVGLKWLNVEALQPSDVNALATHEGGDASWIHEWKGEGKYSGDQQFHECRIDELTKYGAKITFTGYGNQEEVPLAYLRPLKARTEKLGSVGGIKAIPEKLQIKDTDSEQQRQYKLKKSRGIRSQNREVKKEEEAKAVQKSWQKFVAKGTRKHLAGMSSLTNKTSTGSVSVSGSSGDSGNVKSAAGASRKRMRFNDSKYVEE